MTLIDTQLTGRAWPTVQRRPARPLMRGERVHAAPLCQACPPSAERTGSRLLAGERLQPSIFDPRNAVAPVSDLQGGHGGPLYSP